jgi:hypothetical protein
MREGNMELEFPGFVALLLVAVGLVVLGPVPHSSRERLDRVAAATAAVQCVGANAPALHDDPSPPAACTIY